MAKSHSNTYRLGAIVYVLLLIAAFAAAFHYSLTRIYSETLNGGVTLGWIEGGVIFGSAVLWLPGAIRLFYASLGERLTKADWLIIALPLAPIAAYLAIVLVGVIGLFL